MSFRVAFYDEGLLAARPAAAAGNSGRWYYATNDNGGTLYKSNGTTWTKLASGATESSSYADSAIATHSADTTAVHGIADSSVLETTTGAQTKATAAETAAESFATSAISTHSADTMSVHGITDTTALVLSSDSRLTDARTPTSHVHAGSDITSGTVADARIDSAIARDSEVSAAISALSSVYQPLDSDLTSIAALTTTSFGRALLELADQAALLAAAGAASAAHAHSGGDITSGIVVDARIDSAIARDAEVASAISASETTTAGAIATHAADTTSIHGITDTSALETTTGAQAKADAAAAASQPLDSDLTAIAALSTTSYGRALLILADQAALLAATGAAASSHTHSGAAITSGTVAEAYIDSTIARDSEVTSAIAALSSTYQPLDSDLTAIAALSTTSFGRSLLTAADAAAARSTLGVTSPTLGFAMIGLG